MPKLRLYAFLLDLRSYDTYVLWQPMKVLQDVTKELKRNYVGCGKVSLRLTLTRHFQPIPCFTHTLRSVVSLYPCTRRRNRCPEKLEASSTCQPKGTQRRLVAVRKEVYTLVGRLHPIDWHFDPSLIFVCAFDVHRSIGAQPLDRFRQASIHPVGATHASTAYCRNQRGCAGLHSLCRATFFLECRTRSSLVPFREEETVFHDLRRG
jgi:hypothetical protein